ncbi:MAG TPA: SAF domain-containing protein [Nocardioides sp.]|nr:SAF domain-containing protein [Nocardioides sp.]
MSTAPPLPRPRPARAWRRVRRAVLARRRPLAAVLAGLAVLAGVRAYAAPPPPTVEVLTAAHDIAPGATVAPDDLVRRPFPPDAVPDGLVRSAGEAVGRTTTGPIRAGEPLTEVRLLTDDLLAHHPGTVAAPVRIGDPGAVRLLRVGDRISLYAADPQGEREPVEAATAVPVIALPRARDEGVDSVSGALVVVAVPPATARTLAGLGVSSFLSAVLVR